MWHHHIAYVRMLASAASGRGSNAVAVAVFCCIRLRTVLCHFLAPKLGLGKELMKAPALVDSAGATKLRSGIRDMRGATLALPR